MSENAHKIGEFEGVTRILAGVDTHLDVSETESGRMARAMFESHLAMNFDRPGCFAFVGWIEDACPGGHDQLKVYAAFARGAVVAGVYLGAMEPGEGFGLVCWDANPQGTPEAAAKVCYEKMLAAARYAASVIVDDPGKKVLGQTAIALGYGQLRGQCLFDGKARPNFLLEGAAAVASIYGEIPNRCGGLAKGKDAHSMGKNKQSPAKTPWLHTFTFRPLQILMAQGVGALFGQLSRRGELRMPQAEVEDGHAEPEEIEKGMLQPYLVGFSLDFAQSRLEFGRNPYFARIVVDVVLSHFEEMARKVAGMYISPRYGDGLGAVIVTTATKSDDAYVSGEWPKKMAAFCERANAELANCVELGLRIGTAVILDTTAATARLAGVGKEASPAVEVLANEVIEHARECHKLSKRSPLSGMKAERLVRLLQWDPAAPGGVKPIKLTALGADGEIRPIAV